ncbi:MAG TPA: Do family serine endopeptidase [Terriglobales bacterium]|nr:Do family serine endopeptidase [Terriglobales bacterium]
MERTERWITHVRKGLSKRLIAPAVAIAMVGSVAGYEMVKPPMARASAATVTSSVSPLDDNSVSALLALNHAMETLAARVTPAVVNVSVTSKTKVDLSDQQDGQDMQNSPFGQFGFGFPQQQPRNQIEHGIGSGVIISPDGYIVTNNHVVQGAMDIRVTMSDRRILNAKLIGADPLTDLAVIKVNGTNLPNVPLGDSTQLRPGETVLAFGNPYGMRFTVTQGIVSALNRPNPDPTDRHKPGEFIQTDAAINPGNSGGPLVDARGEVIGINTFLISPSGSFSGMGFAIPTQIVKPTVDQLIHNGKVRHSYIGVGITDVTPENSKFFDMTKATGAVVSQVEPSSPAANAGLKVGDVITELNGKEVTDAGQLQVEVGEMEPGTKVELGVMRSGKSMNVPVTLEELGKHDNNLETASNNGQGKARWGIGLQDLTPDLRDQLQAPSDVQGAVIARVQPGSSADQAGLQTGEIIQKVDHQNTKSAADVQQALSKVPQGQDALVLIWANGGSTFAVLHPNGSRS